MLQYHDLMCHVQDNGATNTPEEFLAFTRAEYAKYGKLVKDAGMQPE